MRKIILVLAIALMASPVFALTVTLQRQGTTNIVAVNYSGADSANLPRLFALDVTIDNPARIADVTNFKTGESNSVSPGFGIYPAKIDINSAGVVNSWGNPQADTTDAGASGTGIGTRRVILEFASLYYGDANAPNTSGKLCDLTINPNGADYINLRVQGETTYRGGVVLEDGTQVAVDTNYISPPPPPGKATNPNPANGATGVARTGTSLTWTSSYLATSRDVYFGTASPGTFIGNQIPTSYAIPGTMAQGKLYYWRIDEKNAAGTTTGDVWSFRTLECLRSTSTEYTKWITYGRPDCWCFRRQCRGDADGVNTLSKPVANPDLSIFKGGFNKAASVVRDLIVGGKPAICADFDRKDTISKPVANPDLNIFKAYFGRSVTQVPQCDMPPVVGLYNFWMN